MKIFKKYKEYMKDDIKFFIKEADILNRFGKIIILPIIIIAMIIAGSICFILDLLFIKSEEI